MANEMLIFSFTRTDFVLCGEAVTWIFVSVCRQYFDVSGSVELLEESRTDLFSLVTFSLKL